MLDGGGAHGGREGRGGVFGATDPAVDGGTRAQPGVEAGAGQPGSLESVTERFGGAGQDVPGVDRTDPVEGVGQQRGGIQVGGVAAGAQAQRGAAGRVGSAPVEAVAVLALGGRVGVQVVLGEGAQEGQRLAGAEQLVDAQDSGEAVAGDAEPLPPCGRAALRRSGVLR